MLRGGDVADAMGSCHVGGGVRDPMQRAQPSDSEPTEDAEVDHALAGPPGLAHLTVVGTCPASTAAGDGVAEDCDGPAGRAESVPEPTVEELFLRAERLRRWAEHWPGPLATACRRRAAELEFVVTVLEPLVDEVGPRPGARVRLGRDLTG